MYQRKLSKNANVYVRKIYKALQEGASQGLEPSQDRILKRMIGLLVLFSQWVILDITQHIPHKLFQTCTGPVEVNWLLKGEVETEVD